MFLNRNKKGFGWHATISTKDIGLKDSLYMNFSFKKGCEPAETDSIKGDLYFISEEGARKVYPVAKEYNGRVSIEYKLLELEEPKTPVKRYTRNEVKADVEFDNSDYPWEL